MSQLIAAISTPPGPGGVGILRLSGPGAIGAASQAFRPRGKVPLAQAPDRQLLYGAVLDRDGRTIDTGLAFVSRAPHSYTGEETAELQCHGSPMVLALALEALYPAGGVHPAGLPQRQAGPDPGRGGHRPHRRGEPLRRPPGRRPAHRGPVPAD